MSMGLVSLLALIGAIIVGFKCKINTGMLCIGLALIIGRMGGMKDKAIMGGFGSSLFLMLLGVMFLFSIAQRNGTLELLAKKAVACAGRQTWLVPIIVFFVGMFLAAIGPGAIPVMALMAVFSMALAAQMNINPLMLGPIALLGSLGGGMSPLAPTGILGQMLSEGYDVGMPLFANSVVVSFLYSAILYFAFGGHKAKSDTPLRLSDLASFNRAQQVTLVGIFAMVVSVIFFGVNVGLASFAAAAALLLLRVADEKQSIAGVPWATLCLVTGVGVLMNVVIKLKGITLLSEFLATFMSEGTAPGIMSATAGIMSWFSSTSGVVMPTLIPTINELVGKLNGADLQVLGPVLVSVVSVAAHTAGVSPISTGGSLAYAAYSEAFKATPEEQHSMFIKLFLLAIGGVTFVTIYSFLGCMNWVSALVS